jgi:2-phospho-L-lactate guanylyltransferase
LTPDPTAAGRLGLNRHDDPTVTIEVQPTGDSLNAGIDRAIASVRSRASRQICVAVVVADLPALVPHELTAVLELAAELGQAAVVADRTGTGSTVLALPAGTGLAADFGPDSLVRHVAAGAVAGSAGASLRCDVDSVADLRIAAGLGLGPATTALLDASPLTLGGMQATVAHFDESTQAGTVLLDDGVELAFDAEAFASSGLRLLRLGQRVRIDVDAARQHVVSLTILTLG